MGYIRCDAQILPPGMVATVKCALVSDHTGLHYYAETHPDVHIAISWHASFPMPVSVSITEVETA